MMGNAIHGECTLEDRRRPRVGIALVVNHDTRPAKPILCIRHDSGSIKPQSLFGEMSGNDIAIVSFYGFSEKGHCAGKNRLAVGRSGEILDACGGVDEMVIRS